MIGTGSVVTATRVAASTSTGTRRRHQGVAASPAMSTATSRSGRARLSTGQGAPSSPAHSTTRSGARATTSAGPARSGDARASSAAMPVRMEATAAAGTATRLAGTDPSGTSSNTRSRIGATPTCAATVTATSRASHTGSRCSRARSHGASPMIPAVAPTDSSSPTLVARNGSTRTSSVTARPSTCHGCGGTPRTSAPSSRTTMPVARSTDGSARVRRTNHASPTSTTTRRTRRDPPTPRTANASAATTIATFDPETATRWVSPAWRSRVTTSTGRPSVSPVTSPEASPAVSSGSHRRVAVRSRCRTKLVDRHHQPGVATTVASSMVMRATRCRPRRTASYPSARRGRAVTDPVSVAPAAGVGGSPVTRTRSPDLRVSSWSTVATACQRPNRSTGSLTTRTTAVRRPPRRARSTTGP